ncbi:MAG: glycine cleavage system protein GcvH [Bacteriovoracia bacterium]
MKFPNDLKYTKDHEWARIEGNTVTVGITDHAQSALGDIVYVELPAKGKELKKGGTFGVVESIKAVSDLYAPISGTILEMNAAVVDAPATLNQSPHEDGWLVKIVATNPAELGELMDATAYEKYVSSLK